MTVRLGKTAGIVTAPRNVIPCGIRAICECNMCRSSKMKSCGLRLDKGVLRMTVSENFANLVLSLLNTGFGSTDSAKILKICEISPADFDSIKSSEPRMSIYEIIDRLYFTVFW